MRIIKVGYVFTRPVGRSPKDRKKFVAAQIFHRRDKTNVHAFTSWVRQTVISQGRAWKPKRTAR